MTLTYPGPSNTPADLATLDNEEVGSQERTVFCKSGPFGTNWARRDLAKEARMSTDEAVKVAVRVRPFNKREIAR